MWVFILQFFLWWVSCALPTIHAPSTLIATKFPYSIEGIKLNGSFDNESLSTLAIEADNAIVDRLETFPGLWTRHEENRALITGLVEDIQLYLDDQRLQISPPGSFSERKATIYFTHHLDGGIAKASSQIVVEIAFRVSISPSFFEIPEDEGISFQDSKVTFLSISKSYNTTRVTCNLNSNHGSIVGSDIRNSTVTNAIQIFKASMYHPDPNFHGIDTIKITCENDLGESDSATLDIAIHSVNDQPQILISRRSFTIEEDNTFQLHELGIKLKDLDAEDKGDDLIAVDLEMNVGIVKLPGPSILGGIRSTKTSSSHLRLVGPLQSVNGALRFVSVSFPPSWSGEDSLRVKCTDDITMTGKEMFFDAWILDSVDILVTNVNDAPHITMDENMFVRVGDDIDLGGRVLFSDIDGSIHDIYSLAIETHQIGGQSITELAYSSEYWNDNVSISKLIPSKLELSGSLSALSQALYGIKLVLKERWFGVMPRGLVLTLEDHHRASFSFESSISVLKADDRPKFHVSALHVSTKEDEPFVISSKLQLNISNVDNRTDHSGTEFYEIRVKSKFDGLFHFHQWIPECYISGLGSYTKPRQTLIFQGTLEGMNSALQRALTYTPPQNLDTYDTLLFEVSCGEVLSDYIEIRVDIEPVNDSPFLEEARVKELFTPDGSRYLDLDMYVGDYDEGVMDHQGASVNSTVSLVVENIDTYPRLLVLNNSISIDEDEAFCFDGILQFDESEEMNSKIVEIELRADAKQKLNVMSTFEFIMPKMIGGVHFPSLDTAPRESIVLRGTVLRLNKALDQLMLKPPLDFHGNFVINLKVPLGGTATDILHKIDVDVKSLHDDPVILWDEDQLTEERSKLIVLLEDDSISLDKFSFQDVDTDDAAISFRALEGQLCMQDENNDMTCESNGGNISFVQGINAINKAVNSMVYKPGNNWWGIDKLHVTMETQGKQSFATVDFHVKPVHDVPVIKIANATINIGSPNQNIIGVSIQDPDVDFSIDESRETCAIRPSSCNLTVKIWAKYGTLSFPENIHSVDKFEHENDTIFLIGSIEGLNDSLQGMTYIWSPNPNPGNDTLSIEATDADGLIASVSLHLLIKQSHESPPIIMFPSGRIFELEEDNIGSIGETEFCELPHSPGGLSIIACGSIQIKGSSEDEHVAVQLAANQGSIKLPRKQNSPQVATQNGFSSNAHFSSSIRDINAFLEILYFKASKDFNSRDGQLASFSLTVENGRGYITEKALSIYIIPVPDPPVIELESGIYDHNQTASDGIGFKLIGVKPVPVQGPNPIPIEGIRVRDVDCIKDNDLLELTIGSSFGYVSLLEQAAPIQQWISGYRGIYQQEIILQSSILEINKALQHLIYRPQKDPIGNDEITLSIADLGDKELQNKDEVVIPLQINPNSILPRIQGPHMVHMKEDSAKVLNFRLVGGSFHLSDVQLSIFFTRGRIKLLSEIDLILQQSDHGLSGVGSLDAWNNALSKLVYTPPRDWYTCNGQLDAITFEVKNAGFQNIIEPNSHTTFIDIEGRPDPHRWMVDGENTILQRTGDIVVVSIDTIDVEEDSSAILSIALLDADNVPEPTDVFYTVQISSFAGAHIRLSSYHGIFMKGDFRSGLGFEATFASLNDAVKSLSYTPPLNFNGRDIITLFASDGNLTKSTTKIPINVTPTEDIPLIRVPFIQNCVQDQACNVFQEVFLDDPDGNAMLTIDLHSDVGRMSFSESRDFSVLIAGSRMGDSSFTFKGSGHSINFLLKSIIYLPGYSSNFPLIDSIAFTVRDKYLEIKSQSALQVFVSKSSPIASTSDPTLTYGLDVNVIVSNEYDSLQIIAEEKLYFVSEDEYLAVEGISISLSRVPKDNESIITQAIIEVTHGRIMLSRNSSMIEVQDLSFVKSNEWYTNVSLCGSAIDVSAALGEISFSPNRNWNSDEGDHGNISVSVGRIQSCESKSSEVTELDNVEDFISLAIHVRSINDDPVVMTDKHNISVDEDHEERVHIEIVDADSTTIKVSLNPNGFGMVAVSHNKKDYTNAFFMTGDGDGRFHESITFQGTIPAVNEYLSNFRFLGSTNYHSTEGTLYISATDDLGGFASMQLNVTIHSVQDDVILWSLVDSSLEQPIPKFKEGERRIIASDWLLDSHLYTEMIIPLASHDHDNTLRPHTGLRPFAVSNGDDPYSSTDIRVCIGVSTDKGIISVNDVDKMIAFNTDSRGKYLEFAGNISFLNEVFKTLMYEAVRNESGLVTVLVTAVKEYCDEDRNLCSCNFDMLGTKKGTFHISVTSMNSPPIISRLDSSNVLEATVDTPLYISGLVIEDSDVSEEDLLTLDITLSKGILSLVSSHKLSFIKGTGFNDTKEMHVLGTLKAINAAISSLSYTCRSLLDGCEVGTKEHITIRVSDNGFNGQGGPGEDQISFILEIS